MTLYEIDEKIKWVQEIEKEKTESILTIAYDLIYLASFHGKTNKNPKKEYFRMLKNIFHPQSNKSHEEEIAEMKKDVGKFLSVK